MGPFPKGGRVGFRAGPSSSWEGELPSSVWDMAEEGWGWAELMGCWLAGPSSALSGPSHFPSKPSFLLSFLQGFGGRAVSGAVLALRGCSPAPSPPSILLPPCHLCPFELAASSSQGNHDEKEFKKKRKKEKVKVSRTCLCGWFVLLGRRVEVWGLQTVALHQSHRKRDPWSGALHGLIVVTSADKQTVRN